MHVIDLTGQRFGRLVVSGLTRSQHRRWRCQCDCGGERIARTSELRSGRVLSCGCLRRESAARVGKATTTHGMRYTPEYRAWSGMKQRCTNPKISNFPQYGGRGIRVCDRWMASFDDFLADLGPRPSPDHSLDRIDNDGHYDPSNCQWRTRVEQQRNVSRNRLLTFQGETHPLATWADRTGIPAKTIGRRLTAGWSPERALKQPPRVT